MSHLKFRATVSHRKTGGVTLIEVLVALVILSVGLVGIASLHLFGLKAVHSSFQSSTASVIALDLEEWLWEALGNDGLQNRQECDAVINNFRQDWFGGNDRGRWLPEGDPADRLVGGCDEPTRVTSKWVEDPCWISVEFSIRWPESRFTGSVGEDFRYRIQLPCSPS